MFKVRLFSGARLVRGRIAGFGFRVPGFGFRVSGSGFRVSDFGGARLVAFDERGPLSSEHVTYKTVEVRVWLCRCMSLNLFSWSIWVAQLFPLGGPSFQLFHLGGPSRSFNE